MDTKIFGGRVKTAREEQGLSQWKLAEMVGLDQPHISRLERGISGISTEKLVAIAKILRLSIDDLVSDAVAEEKENYEGPDPRAAIVASYDAPRGLRDLALDQRLVDALEVTPVEWRRLISVDLPLSVTKDGYLQLLITLRTITGR